VLTFRISGRNLKANLVERAISLSHDKYCSATKMLGMTAEITTHYELTELA
jgi:putative redox protein